MDSNSLSDRTAKSTFPRLQQSLPPPPLAAAVLTSCLLSLSLSDANGDLAVMHSQSLPIIPRIVFFQLLERCKAMFSALASSES